MRCGVGFLNGHVEAVAAQVRPARAYRSPKADTDAGLLTCKTFKIGIAVLQPIDFAQVPDDATYVSLLNDSGELILVGEQGDEAVRGAIKGAIVLQCGKMLRPTGVPMGRAVGRGCANASGDEKESGH